jgi:hypothetical protein
LPSGAHLHQRLIGDFPVIFCYLQAISRFSVDFLEDLQFCRPHLQGFTGRGRVDCTLAETLETWGFSRLRRTQKHFARA